MKRFKKVYNKNTGYCRECVETPLLHGKKMPLSGAFSSVGTHYPLKSYPL